MAYIGGDKSTITNIWRRRVQNFWLEMTQNARPSNIIRKMKPPPNRDDPVIRAILNLDQEDQPVKASERLLDYLVSEEGLEPGQIADRWLVFDQALSQAHPLLYDIVDGRFDNIVQEQQKQVVRTCMDEICNVVDAEDLFESLASKNLLGDMEFDTLNSRWEERGATQNVSYMVRHLHRCSNRNWYQDFVEVLCEAGHEMLVEKLNDTYDDFPADAAPFNPVPAQEARALCSDFQKLSVQKTYSDVPKPQCPACRGVYNLGAGHKCRASGTMRSTPHERDSTAPSGSHTQPSEQPASSAKPPQPCPTCGKMFKQLSRHKCKAAASLQNQGGISAAGIGAQSWESPAAMLSQNGQQCPYCGKVFIRLSKHVCKAVGQVVTTTSGQLFGQPADLARPQEQQCPTCGKLFKQLSRHKCKALF
ncbi:uncharacterized protein [Littorina saxatilis]|uniref:uncharacterized protein isoform X2 n=1 Tax=Littorina saxatilis TaxID=31220 RepID=UPI0038B485DB